MKFRFTFALLAAIAMVGAVRTNTLEMLVPSAMREVRVAQAASTAN